MKKPQLPVIIAHDGSEIRRRNKLEYWFDRRRSTPTPFARGFPNDEANAIRAAGRLIMTGIVSKIRCTDRVADRVIWTLIRGERVLGTNLYSVVPMRGDSDLEAAPARLRRVA